MVGSPICSWQREIGNWEVRMKSLLEIWALEQAEKELRDSASLSVKSYHQILPLVEENRKRIQSENPVEVAFDRREFLACITDRRVSLQSHYDSRTRIEGDRSDARFDYKSLLPEGDMDRILRYEERMHRQIDWAVQRLMESQERRKNIQSCFSENEKRSQ
jgi:hypothetical protein